MTTKIDVNVLCRHLQNEHCFDLKNAVCPLAAGNLGKQPTVHFVARHSSSLKRRKRSHKSIFWSSDSATLGNELTSFLGSKANVREITSDPMPYPVLSPFLCSTQEHCQQDEASKAALSSAPDKKVSSSVDEDCRQCALFNSLSLLPSSKASFGLNTRKPNWQRT